MKKRLIQILMAGMILSFIPCQSYAVLGGTGIHSTLQVITNKNLEKETDRNNNGKRDNTMPVYCYISENGIETDVPLFGITSYEVWDAQGVAPLAVFTNEYDFISYLFSLSGSYVIVLETDDLILSGQVFIE